jgi:hypothetical protein
MWVLDLRGELPIVALVRLMLEVRPMSVVDTGLAHAGAEYERETAAGSSSGKPTFSPRGDKVILT